MFLRLTASSSSGSQSVGGIEKRCTDTLLRSLLAAFELLSEVLGFVFVRPTNSVMFAPVVLLVVKREKLRRYHWVRLAMLRHKLVILWCCVAMRIMNSAFACFRAAKVPMFQILSVTIFSKTAG